ncbi:SPOR domain-containing protein [Alloalcanivorax mobilis]|uniref:SPOR domain-containing protein n=1 Tax=Alloalcanivorax mobilis TaxID=2019569 RepID=UPI000B5B1BA7|nr:SPOR domain-containing protein [Alloalcanivorax mobilis]ASK35270.1 cell division protein [Alcanivorax sp. N3-2A]
MRDEDFFYEGAERGDLLDALNGHAHEGATTVLEGDTGSGVSTLLGMLAMSLVSDFELIRLDGAEALDANAVVDAMLGHFGIERTDLAETLKQTLAHNRLMIVVDNAEQLESAALTTMASLKQKLGQRLAYVFGGVPGTSEKVRAAGLTVADTLVLPSLDDEQVIAFVEEAFAIDLDDEQAAELRERSDGLPGPLLGLLEHHESRPPAAATTGGRRPIPLRHGLAVGALVLVVLVLWLASGGDDDEAPASSRVVGLKVPAPPAAPPADPDAQAEAKPQRPALINSPEQSRRALAEYADSAKAFEKAESRREPPAQEAAPATDKPAPASADQPAARPQPAQTQTPAPAPASKPATPAAAASDYRQAGWLAGRADSDWFLQLIATGREEGARGVLDQLRGEGAYYRTRRGEKTVYLVVAGPYASRDAALAARETLPDALRKSGPFPRPMADIRKELP